MLKKVFMSFVALAAIAAAATGPARAQSNEQLFYTLDGTQTGGGSAYNDASTITQDGVTWSVTGNTTQNPWRIGGKSLNAVDREVYSTGALDETITKVTLDYGYKTGITVNSVTMIVASDAAFTNIIEEKDVAFEQESTVNVTPGTGISWTNAYYKFVFNVTYASSNSNKYFELNAIRFYYDANAGGGSTPEPPAPAVTHTVRLAAGTEDAANWSLASGNASVSGTQVLENVMSGSELTATYNGTQKVKSVKAVKYVAPAATVTTVPTATAALIAANSTSALVNAGAANGGTMMYAVTTTNAQPASTADFSASIPTAEGRTAGTYYVWYYAKADADHSDSEIAGPVSVTLATIVTWNSTNVFNSAHMDDVLDEWYTTPLTYEGITISLNVTGAGSNFDVCDDLNQIGQLTCFGEDGDSFTFTAPAGKKFCKIEIIDNEDVSFDDYGDWRQINNKIVWSGTAANAVTLGTVFTYAGNLNSIVFTLIDD